MNRTSTNACNIEHDRIDVSPESTTWTDQRMNEH